MAISKLTAVMFVVCFLTLYGQSLANGQTAEDEVKVARQHHFVKRQADYEDIGESEGDSVNYERSFDRPHRIRVLPGFLH